jgi:hypothetical protein
MDSKLFNQNFNKILEIRKELNAMEFNSARYDDLEETLADFEDDFMVDFGEDLDDILLKIHHTICPDIESAHPMAYFARNYTESEFVPGDYEINTGDGIKIIAEMGSKKIKGSLVWLPNPARLVLVSAEDLHVLWNSEKPDQVNLG